MVNALAGTGKTTTVLWGAGDRVPDDISVSSEQKDIIKEMRKHRGTIAACAFNKSIAMELQERAPRGVECATSNAFGHRAWCRFMEVSKLEPDALKNRRLCREELGQRFNFKERVRIECAVDDIVGFCKNFLFDPCASDKVNHINDDISLDGIGAMRYLCDTYGIDSDPVVLEFAQKIFKKGVDAKGYIDWDDQVFMPLWYNVPLQVFDHLIVDECQDLNRAKQELAFRMGKYITCVGDVNQAIYGFSGADAEAMQNLWKRMVNADKKSSQLPMTITRRCPKLVVQKANIFVPELRARDDAPNGIVADISERKFMDQVMKEPSMVVCRVNAPLTSLAFKMIARGVRCYIQGRDIGTGIKSEIKRTGEQNLSTAVAKVHDRIERKKMEIGQRDFVDEAAIEALTDKMICIDILSGDCDNVQEFCDAVDKLFKDSGGPNDIRLSSVHKAKGLEHEKVYVYKADKLRLKTKKAYQAKQENNLAYVAYTRSKSELYSVFEEQEDDISLDEDDMTQEFDYGYADDIPDDEEVYYGGENDE